MSIELKIPDVGESIREVQIGRWLKKEGDAVDQDEDVVQLETDKASMELPAPEAGVLAKILKKEGETVAVGEVIGYLESNGQAAREKPAPAEKPGNTDREQPAAESTEQKGTAPLAPAPEEAAESRLPESTQPAAEAAGGEESPKTRARKEQIDGQQAAKAIVVTPSARRALRDHGLSAADIPIKGDRIGRKDVLRFVEKQEQQTQKQKVKAHDDSGSRAKTHDTSSIKESPVPSPQPPDSGLQPPAAGHQEKSVPMSLIRRRIAERLVEAQQQAALLTTFNEIDMSAVKQLRAAYRDRFQEKHGVKLGFMSFFVKAVVEALRELPELNAEIRGDQIVYHNYYDIGVAIGSEKGLVVPVIRSAERLSFAEIERTIDDFAKRAAQNKLKPQDLEGGTFTITNGGVYGSLLSTPIVNPPQSGVLGMHAIQDRAIAHEGQIVIRPMMYVALTYDHRLVDGREAVTFLKRVKETIEDPARMLLAV